MAFFNTGEAVYLVAECIPKSPPSAKFGIDVVPYIVFDLRGIFAAQRKHKYAPVEAQLMHEIGKKLSNNCEIHNRRGIFYKLEARILNPKQILNFNNQNSNPFKIFGFV